MRTPPADVDHQSSAAAPYVATLQLADDCLLSLALPGVGERVLASAAGAAGEVDLVVLPSSSAAQVDPDNPVRRAAAWARGVHHRGLRLRHERGLGDSTALGDRAAATCAAVLAVAGLGEDAPDWRAVAMWLTQQSADPATDGACAIAAAWHGGAWLDFGAGPVCATPPPDLRLVVIMPGEGVPAVHNRGADSVLPATAHADLASIDLDRLKTTPTRPRLEHPAWLAAATAARDAGADYVHVANGGRCLVALTSAAALAGAIRGAAIDAFAAQGVWSRGRAGPINARGAMYWAAQRPDGDPPLLQP